MGWLGIKRHVACSCDVFLNFLGSIVLLFFLVSFGSCCFFLLASLLKGWFVNTFFADKLNCQQKGQHVW